MRSEPIQKAIPDIEPIRVELAIYGGIPIPRGTCPQCGDRAFILDNIFQCCGLYVRSLIADGFKVEVSTPKKRRGPSRGEAKKLLRLHGKRCYWCRLPFGLFYQRKGRYKTTKLNWDHLIPVARGGLNVFENFVPSCNLCNSLKHSKVFDTAQEMSAYIERRWPGDGITVEVKNAKFEDLSSVRITIRDWKGYIEQKG